MTDFLPQIFKLLIYLRVQDNIHLIDIIVGEDYQELEKLGKERSNNNKQYICIITAFKLVDAKVVS